MSIESIARQLDGATPSMEVVDEYHDTVRETVVKDLATAVITSIFDETGKTTDSLIERIENDNSIPQDLKRDVFVVSEMALRKMLDNISEMMLKGSDSGVGSKEIPE